MRNIATSLRTKLLLTALVLSFAVFADAHQDESAAPDPLVASVRPQEFEGIGITENLGTQIDLGLKFKDESGSDVTLGKYFDGTHPVIISLVYYSCPGLCNFHLNGVVDTLKKIDWNAGDKFQLLAISFDPKEGPSLAAGKKATYIKEYGRASAEKGFHFLTADADNIKKITESLGFRYRWDDHSKQWAHASAAVITTPRGKISRYLHGIMFDDKTFKLALNESTEGHIGNFVDQMVYFCFKYDPSKSKYSLYAFRIVQIGAVMVILILAGLLGPVWWRARRDGDGA